MLNHAIRLIAITQLRYPNNPLYTQTILDMRRRPVTCRIARSACLVVTLGGIPDCRMRLRLRYSRERREEGSWVESVG